MDQTYKIHHSVEELKAFIQKYDTTYQNHLQFVDFIRAVEEMVGDADISSLSSSSSDSWESDKKFTLEEIEVLWRHFHSIDDDRSQTIDTSELRAFTRLMFGTTHSTAEAERIIEEYDSTDRKTLTFVDFIRFVSENFAVQMPALKPVRVLAPTESDVHPKIMAVCTQRGVDIRAILENPLASSEILGISSANYRKPDLAFSVVLRVTDIIERVQRLNTLLSQCPRYSSITDMDATEPLNIVLVAKQNYYLLEKSRQFKDWGYFCHINEAMADYLTTHTYRQLLTDIAHGTPNIPLFGLAPLNRLTAHGTPSKPLFASAPPPKKLTVISSKKKY